MPDMNEEISAVGRIIQAITALLGLMPAIAVLAGLVDIPPDLADLIRVLTFFASAAVILGIILMRGTIRRAKAGPMAGFVLGAILLGSVAATSYWLLAVDHIVTIRYGDKVERDVVPLHPTRRITDVRDAFGGSYEQALVTYPQRDDLRRWMREESKSASVLLLFLLVAANVLLVSGLVVGAWRAAGTCRSTKKTAPSPPPGNGGSA